MNARIIAVEDEPEVLDLIGDVLAMGEFTVIGVPRPALVWEAIDAHQPDLLLMDIMLPGMSGVELALQLRETIPTCPPMIALSASRLMLGLAKSSGHFVAAISNPFDIETLLATVERALKPADVSL
jgi:DNA-binding response OmpR family regulator